jgi:hypothetical protein
MHGHLQMQKYKLDIAIDEEERHQHRNTLFAFEHNVMKKICVIHPDFGFHEINSFALLAARYETKRRKTLPIRPAKARRHQSRMISSHDRRTPDRYILTSS